MKENLNERKKNEYEVIWKSRAHILDIIVREVKRRKRERERDIK